MIKEEKERNVEELNKVFTEAKGIYLADFTGIDVKLINELRRQFRKENVSYRVIKNTLALRSLEGHGYEGLIPHFIGPTALAYSLDDPLLPGKLIEDFHKKNEKLDLKAAIIEGEVFGFEAAQRIIKLPPKEQLIAQLLMTLNSPISGLIYTLNGILRNFVSVLDQIRKLKEKEGVEPQAEPREETGKKAEKIAGEAESDTSAVEVKEETEPQNVEVEEEKTADEKPAEDVGGEESDEEAEKDNSEGDKEDAGDK